MTTTINVYQNTNFTSIDSVHFTFFSQDSFASFQFFEADKTESSRLLGGAVKRSFNQSYLQKKNYCCIKTTLYLISFLQLQTKSI